MIIQLDSNTRIVGTDRAWELQHPRTRKGVEVWVPCKWFNSFGSALEQAVHREIRMHPAKRVVRGNRGRIRRCPALYGTDSI